MFAQRLLRKKARISLVCIYRSLGVGDFAKLGCLPVFKDEQPAVDFPNSQFPFANFWGKERVIGEQQTRVHSAVEHSSYWRFPFGRTFWATSGIFGE